MFTRKMHINDDEQRNRCTSYSYLRNTVIVTQPVPLLHRYIRRHCTSYYAIYEITSGRRKRFLRWQVLCQEAYWVLGELCTFHTCLCLKSINYGPDLCVIKYFYFNVYFKNNLSSYH